MRLIPSPRQGRLLATGLLTLALASCSNADTAVPLASVSLTPSTTRAIVGGPLEFTYRFEVAPDASFDGDYRVFTHILDLDGRVVWNDDHLPPVLTSAWTPGQVVEYQREQFVPRMARAGDVTVEVGLYRGDMRLPLAGPDPADRELNTRAYRVAALQLLPETEGIFLVQTSGWHDDEFEASGPEAVWRWTQRVGTLSFANPHADTVLHLDFSARPDAFGDAPQTVTISAGDQTVDTFLADNPAREIRRIPIPASALGTSEAAEIHLTVDRTFVPASLPAGGRDDRELGIRVYHLFLERR